MRIMHIQNIIRNYRTSKVNLDDGIESFDEFFKHLIHIFLLQPQSTNHFINEQRRRNQILNGSTKEVSSRMPRGGPTIRGHSLFHIS